MLAAKVDPLKTIIAVVFFVAVVAVTIRQLSSLSKRIPRKKVIEMFAFAFGCGSFLSGAGTIINAQLGGPAVVTWFGIAAMLVVVVVGLYRNREYLPWD